MLEFELLDLLTLDEVVLSSCEFCPRV